MSKVLPENILKRMDAKDRAKLPGKSGMTIAEIESQQIAKCETELQTQIKSMLERNGIWVIHQPTRKRSQLRPGTADILFAVRGRPIAWEVKMPGNTLDEDQLVAQTQMAHNGWLFDVIYSYDEALRLFHELNK